MKRIKYIILMFIMSIILMPSIFASSNVTITSISLEDKSDDVVINDEANIDNLNINTDLSFLNVGDYVKYKIVLKNSTDKEYNISNSIDNENEYINYDLDIYNVISPNTEVIGYVTITYNKKLENYENGTYSFENNAAIPLTAKETTNPKTGDTILFYFTLLIISGTAIVILIKFKNKYNKNIILPIITLAFISLGVYSVNALNSISITINTKITIFEDADNDSTADVNEYVSITFDAGEYGQINGNQTYETDQTYLPGYSKYPASPEVTANENYKFNGWTPSYVEGNLVNSTSLTYTATYYEDKNNNNVDDSTELISITFDAGDHGQINGNQTYETDQTYLPGYSKYPASPEVTANENYKFNGWTPNYTEGDALEAEPTTTYIAIYYEDKNNNNVDDSTELISITFDAGEYGQINGNQTYETGQTYLPGYSKYPASPEVTANENYKFNGWTPSYVEGNLVNSTSLTYTATYYEDKNNNNVDDSTELVAITFDAGDHGQINGNQTYETGQTYLPGYSKYPASPEVTANENYKFNGWTPSYVEGNLVNSTSLTYTATYYEDKNNNNVDDSTELVAITFNAGGNGTINGNSFYTTSREYLTGYSNYPSAPSVTPNENYKFNGWTPSYAEGNTITSTSMLTYTATYYEDKNNNNIDDSIEAVEIVFNAGDHGLINGKSSYTTSKEYLIDFSKYPTAPSVTPNENYKFNGWTPSYIVGSSITSSSTLTYTATYYEDKNNNNIDDSTELIAITFNAGTKGTINGGATYTTNKEYLPGYSKYPTAPALTVTEEGYTYSFNGYDTTTTIPLENPTTSFAAVYFKTYSTGDSIKLGSNQDFYVITSDNNTTLLFAAYNLNVGNYQNSSVTTGIQDSTIRAWVSATADNFGNSYYYDIEGNATSGTTVLDGYLSNYKTYLEETFNISIKNIDLLSRTTAMNVLGMKLGKPAFATTSSYYSWMTYTTFWFKEESNMNGYVYYLGTDNFSGKANDFSGIRPTITLSTYDLYKYLNPAEFSKVQENQLIEELY